ncbi:uncharacterized protein LOC144946523 [Lampetra fluviatilis]
MRASLLVALLAALGAVVVAAFSPGYYARCECVNDLFTGKVKPRSVRRARLVERSFSCSHEEVVIGIQWEKEVVDLCLDTSVSWVVSAVDCMRASGSAGHVACVQRALRRHHRRRGPAPTNAPGRRRGRKPAAGNQRRKPRRNGDR